MFSHEDKNAIIFTQEGTSFNVLYTAQVGFNYDVYKILVWEIFNLRSSSGFVSLIDIGKHWACYQAALKDARTNSEMKHTHRLGLCHAVDSFYPQSEVKITPKWGYFYSLHGLFLLFLEII